MGGDNPDPDPEPTPDPEPETVNIVVTIDWNDDNNRDGLRLSSIYVNLHNDLTDENIANGLVASDNNYTYTFENILKYDSEDQLISYSCYIENVPDKYEDSSSVSVSEDYTCTIILTHTPETINIPVQIDLGTVENCVCSAPTGINITLLGNNNEVGTELIPVDSDYTFEDVYKYEDGKEISYKISMPEIEGYDLTLTGDVTNGFIIYVDCNDFYDWIEDDDNVQLSLEVAQFIAESDTDSSNGWFFTNGIEDQYINLSKYYVPSSITFESSIIQHSGCNGAHDTHLILTNDDTGEQSYIYLSGWAAKTSGGYVSQILGYQYSYSSSTSSSLVAPYHLMFAFDSDHNLLEITVMPGCTNTTDYCASFYDISNKIDTTNTSWVTKSNYVGEHLFTTHFLPPANTNVVVMMPLSYDPRVTEIKTTKTRNIKSISITTEEKITLKEMQDESVEK